MLRPHNSLLMASNCCQPQTHQAAEATLNLMLKIQSPLNLLQKAQLPIFFRKHSCQSSSLSTVANLLQKAQLPIFFRKHSCQSSSESTVATLLQKAQLPIFFRKHSCQFPFLTDVTFSTVIGNFLQKFCKHFSCSLSSYSISLSVSPFHCSRTQHETSRAYKMTFSSCRYLPESSSSRIYLNRPSVFSAKGTQTATSIRTGSEVPDAAIPFKSQTADPFPSVHYVPNGVT